MLFVPVLVPVNVIVRVPPESNKSVLAAVRVNLKLAAATVPDASIVPPVAPLSTRICRFVLCADEPLKEENGELYIRFEYRPTEEKEKQDELNRQAIQNRETADDLAGEAVGEVLVALILAQVNQRQHCNRMDWAPRLTCKKAVTQPSHIEE